MNARIIENVLQRAVSQPGDALFSMRCDCGYQLEQALQSIANGFDCFSIIQGKHHDILHQIITLFKVCLFFQFGTNGKREIIFNKVLIGYET